MPVRFRNSGCLVFFLLCCWGLSFNAIAQRKKKDMDKVKSTTPTQTYRVEVEGSDSYDDEHDVHPLPDSSVLVISSKRNPWFSKTTFVLTRYNRQLQKVWEREYEQKYGTHLYKVAADRKKAYLLYSTRETKKLLLYQVDLATGLATETEHLLSTSYQDIREMKVLQGKLFLYALDNSNLNMLLLDPAIEELRLLPAVFGTEDDLGEFRIDTLTNTAEFVVAESNGFRSRLQTKRMSSSGEVVGTYFLPTNLNTSDDYSLITARLTPGDTLSKLLVGTYGYRTALFARGLFSSDLAGNTKFYDFSKLQYFFEFMTPRRQRKMKEKFARQEALGKPLILRYRLLVHSILPHPKGYAVIGEIYYPQYRSNGYQMPMGNSNLPPMSTNRRMFDGYRFTHAIACVFDHQGNLLWDNSFQLSNDTYVELAPTVEAGVSPEGNITLVYPKEDKLKFKTLRPGVSIYNEDEVAVKTAVETEKLVSSEREGIVNWYGNTFIAFGFQRIRPENGASRTVFVLQAMTFE